MTTLPKVSYTCVGHAYPLIIGTTLYHKRKVFVLNFFVMDSSSSKHVIGIIVNIVEYSKVVVGLVKW